MKKLIYCLFALMVMSCEKEAIMEVPTIVDNARLSLNFKCETMDVISTTTKALTPEKEKEVKDLNIYLVNKGKGFVKHEFVISDHPLSINLPKGEYDIHVVANYGSNMGLKTILEVEMLATSINDETELQQDSVLLMSANQTITINENTSVSIILKRMVAKINVMINTSTFQGFALKSTTLINAPRSCRVSVPNVSLSGMKYASKKGAFLNFYMFENIQGTNNSITSQQEKSKRTAPQQATYIQIIGTYDNYEIEYSIYLGENNTTDFNIHRNKTYLYLIDIKDMDEVDTRVKCIYMTLSPLKASTVVGKAATSDISLIRTSENYTLYSLAYYLDEGTGTVLLNGLQQQQGVFIPFLGNGEMQKNATLTYTQNTASPVRIRVVCKDDDNFMFTRELSTNYLCPPLSIIDVSNTDSQGGDPSTINFTLSKEKYTGNVSYKYEMLLGKGTVTDGVTTLTENVYQQGKLGKQTLHFTPTTVSNATVRVTALLENGETLYRNINIRVLKTIVTVTRTNGDGITFSVSDSKWYDIKTRKYKLPSYFGSTISIGLSVNTSKGPQVLAKHAIRPGNVMELLNLDGTVCNWNGIYNHVVEGGAVNTYQLSITATGPPSMFFELVINK